ncbi:DEAD/DEAH box helicase family protein [Enterocloster citroniae]
MQQLSNGSMKSQVWDCRNLYDFVILDEVHAFVGDAAFNPYTEITLNFLITEVGAQAVRIYISATPDIVIEKLIEVEQRIGAGRNRNVDYSLDGGENIHQLFQI